MINIRYYLIIKEFKSRSGTSPLLGAYKRNSKTEVLVTGDILCVCIGPYKHSIAHFVAQWF